MERIEREVERELARGGGERSAPLSAVTAAWPEAVGENIARNAWPLRIARDGTLHIATSSATWAFELDRMADEIRGKLSARLGDRHALGKVRFAVGPIPEPPTPEAPADEPGPVVEVAPEVAEQAAAAASEIDDPGLRELALRAARASLSHPPPDRRF